MAKSTFRRLWPALLCTLLGVPCVSGAVNKPAAPKPVTVTELVPTKKFVASWVAPVKDAKGQALDPATLTYSVVLRDYINRTVDTLVSNCRDTVLTWDYAGRTGHFAGQVYARNEGGLSAAATGRRIFLGEPFRLPVVESFADGKMSLPFYQAVSGPMQWTMATAATLPATPDADGDGGYSRAMVMTGNSTAKATILSNYIDLSGTTDPVFTMCVYRHNYPEDVSIRFFAIRGGEETLLDSLNLGSLPGPGWHPVGTRLAPFRDGLVQVEVRAESRHASSLLVDAIRIAEGDAFLSAGLPSAPSERRLGSPCDIPVRVMNRGASASAPLTVELLRNGAVAATVRSEGLAPLSAVTVPLRDVLPPDSPDTRLEYSVRVTADDGRTCTTPAVVSAVLPSALPAVGNLESWSKSRIKLTWQAPDTSRIPGLPTIKDFEEDAAWGTAMGSWASVSHDTVPNATFTHDGIRLPVSGDTVGFFVFDQTLYNSYYIGSADCNGTRFAASLNNSSSAGVDDWLVSPELAGCAQRVCADFKAFFKYSLSFEVWYSKGTSAIADFVRLDSIRYSNDWQTLSFDVPEGTRHFAVRAVHARNNSADCPLLMVDNIRYLPLDREARLLGYNVYCGDRLLTPEPVAECRYEGLRPADGGTVCKVTAVYGHGESAPVVVDTSSGVSVLEAQAQAGVVPTSGGIRVRLPEGGAVSVFSLQGVRILARTLGAGETLLPLARGVYLVRVADRAYKVRVN